MNFGCKTFCFENKHRIMSILVKNKLAFFSLIDYNLYKGSQKAQILAFCVTEGQKILLRYTKRCKE